MNAHAKIANDRQPDHAIDPLFRNRWSPRAFDTTEISEAELLTLLEAARWAPSALNIQPWRFVYTRRGDAQWESVLESLAPFNRAWADKASALVLIASETKMTRPSTGEVVDNGAHAFDTGAAWAFLAVQAELAGWRTHAMGGFDHAVAGKAIELPENAALHAVVAIGRAGNPEDLPEMLRAREVPSDRRPLSQTAFAGSFPKA